MTSGGPERPSWAAVDSRYGRAWMTAVRVTAAGWAGVAVLQSPRLPLALLVLSLGAVGGLLLGTGPWAAGSPTRRYAAGALRAAACVLVVVGIGHHLEAGVATVTLLAATSPVVLGRITRLLHG
ncbi:hypothetical protein KM427_08240 [Nocardioides sp. LMS-CY]|uniref:hypothetical protein n=1 Tax=Nocardioides sp. (strain LMS-CY) TaxID=2840457 RepID=UPI001C004DB7|nr:hypothetical protein [Nocardioides sp. LMS-CY]QWF23672.1 hypothetical protein KM427_08240 [Nocardioides sp. LMS-CY]